MLTGLVAGEAGGQVDQGLQCQMTAWGCNSDNLTDEDSRSVGE